MLNYYTAELITSFRFNYKNNYLIIHLIVCIFFYFFQAACEKLSTKKERRRGLWVSKSNYFFFKLALGFFKGGLKVSKFKKITACAVLFSCSILIYLCITAMFFKFFIWFKIWDQKGGWTISIFKNSWGLSAI